MGSKFKVGDRVFFKNILPNIFFVVNDGVGRVTNIVARIDIMTGNIYYRYEVTFDSSHLVDWFDEHELELYVEKSCEPSNNIIQNSATRPCYYLEEKAMFHRWVDETKLIMKFDAAMTTEKMWELKHYFKEVGMVPASVNIVPVTNTFALIEVADGSMKKVPPEEIRFVTKKYQ